MIALVLAALAAPVDSPASWTKFRLNGAQNPVLPGTLQTTWHIPTGGAFSSSPVIAGGVLYVGNNAGRVFAIDPATGRIKWQAHFSNPIMSQPIVTGNLVVVGEGNENSSSGASPSQPFHVGTPPSALIALNRTTGAVIWERALPGTAMPTPAMVGSMLVEHDGAGFVRAFDPARGAQLWSTRVGSIASMSAIVPLGGDLFATSAAGPNTMLLMNARKGAQIWKMQLSPIGAGAGDCPAATDGTRLYGDYVMPPSSAVAVQTEREAIFRAYAVDVRTGKRVWDTFLERGYLPIRNEAAIPLLSGGSLYLGSSLSWQIHALDASAGTVKWRFHTDGAVKGGLVERKGVLYFGDLGGHLWAVNAASGAFIGSIKTESKYNVGSPIIAGRTLIVGAQNGELIAVPLAAIRAGRAR